ncbi:uncharacterized protein EDB91DRAFT_1231303 [Suillus paluster]|uniref:uncharacterized protein n=1 Tax=Suillus paluster TaxID=48578 RepID=UPI001B87E177|nr:uncharacterized protein EDB91DRAFT_1231303 [Suillus paluster]KAG1719767.1 hypothetical protein EDB91DRAFT_1231303 [Suillus paluster]
MDNASNCDATAEHLVTLIDGFRGKLSRSRCFPHTVNLIAKVRAEHPMQAFISFFFRQPKCKKIIATGQHTRKRGPAAVAGASSVTATTTDTTEVEVEQLTADEEHLAADVLEPQSGDGEIDADKDAHDKEVVSAVHRDALNTGKEMGLLITSAEQREALGLFPRAGILFFIINCSNLMQQVAGLAKRLHDSANLQAAFERIVTIEGGGPSQKKTLDRRVPTRWNSDFACLKTHMSFEKEIKLFTSQEANGLQIYALTVTQWKLTKQLIPVLEIFDDLTNRFSQAEVPLVHEVIPMLERLEHMMVKVSRDTELSAIVRVAALAALQVIGKYYALTDDNEVYRIAIIMCPDKKMEWFTKNRDWHEEDKIEARRIATQRWLETYAPTAADLLSTQSSSRPPAVCTAAEKILLAHRSY